MREQDQVRVRADLVTIMADDHGLAGSDVGEGFAVIWDMLVSGII